MAVVAATSLTTTCTAGCIGWASLFFASLKFLTPRSLNKQTDRVYFASSVVGIVHALYTGLSAAYLLLSGKLPMWHSFGEPSPAWERRGNQLRLFCLRRHAGALLTLHAGRQMLLHHFLGLTILHRCVCKSLRRRLRRLLVRALDAIRQRAMDAQGSGGGSATSSTC